MEAMFLSVTDMYSHEFEANNINKLIISETSIFDVLHLFFYHSNVLVRKASLEVYVRRAYISYEMIALQHLFIDSSSISEILDSPVHTENRIPIAVFHFLLPSSHPSITFQPLEAPSSNGTVDDIPHVLQPNYRVGVMAAFRNLEQAEKHFDQLLEAFNRSQKDLSGEQYEPALSTSPNTTQESGGVEGNKFLIYLDIKNSLFYFILSSVRERSSSLISQGPNEPIQIIYIAMKNEGLDDETLSKRCESFCQSRVSQLIYHVNFC